MKLFAIQNNIQLNRSETENIVTVGMQQKENDTKVEKLPQNDMRCYFSVIEHWKVLIWIKLQNLEC